MASKNKGFKWIVGTLVSLAIFSLVKGTPLEKKYNPEPKEPEPPDKEPVIIKPDGTVIDAEDIKPKKTEQLDKQEPSSQPVKTEEPEVVIPEMTQEERLQAKQLQEKQVAAFREEQALLAKKKKKSDALKWLKEQLDKKLDDIGATDVQIKNLEAQLDRAQQLDARIEEQREHPKKIEELMKSDDYLSDEAISQVQGTLRILEAKKQKLIADSVILTEKIKEQNK